MLGSHPVAAFVALALVACTPPRLGPGEISRSEIITEEEVEASHGVTAYEVIQKVRANFLSYRGETSLNPRTSNPYPTVYVDEQPYGPISALRNIPASDIALIRLYRAWEATTRFGTGNMGGVIAIITKR